MDRKKMKFFRKILCNYLNLQQFTGQNDKNSKEIYKGDIWESREHGKLLVKWHNDTGAFGLSFYDKDFKAWDYFDMSLAPLGIIIGNIYEHKDLLNKQ